MEKKSKNFALKYVVKAEEVPKPRPRKVNKASEKGRQDQLALRS